MAIHAQELRQRYDFRHDIATAANIETRQALGSFTSEQRKISSDYSRLMLTHMGEAQSRAEVGSTWDAINSKHRKTEKPETEIPKHPGLPIVKIVDSSK